MVKVSFQVAQNESEPIKARLINLRAWHFSTRMEADERTTWRKYSDKIYEIISASDAARNSLVSKLYAAGLVAENVKIQVQGQAAMTGANTLVNELSTSINVRETKFHQIISVMACVEQLKEVAETMRKDAAILGMCV